MELEQMVAHLPSSWKWPPWSGVKAQIGQKDNWQSHRLCKWQQRYLSKDKLRKWEVEWQDREEELAEVLKEEVWLQEQEEAEEEQ